jgi:hypothetical protein
VQLGAAGTQLRFNAIPETAASTKDGSGDGDGDADLCISARNVDSLCGKTFFFENDAVKHYSSLLKQL